MKDFPTTHKRKKGLLHYHYHAILSVLIIIQQLIQILDVYINMVIDNPANPIKRTSLFNCLSAKREVIQKTLVLWLGCDQPKKKMVTMVVVSGFNWSESHCKA